MDIVTTIAATRAWLQPHRRAGHSVALVPTMGYLHAGHLALVTRAQEVADVVVVSSFVNPLQFGPQEDFSRYPRDPDRDAAMLRQAGVHLLFNPDGAEMYPEPSLTFVEPTRLGDYLCGATRPGHFRGVTTVVSKLLHIVLPDYAVFGEKDAQQLAIIRRMVFDLNFPVEIVGVPIVREADGLALSSRNVFLSVAERQAALVLQRALRLAEQQVAAGERDAGRLTADMAERIGSEPLVRIDYVSAVDAATLQPVQRLEGRVLIALAAFVGKTRLIDNLSLEVVPDAAHLLSR